MSAIFLDFDGTLVESVDIKDRAFQALFADYPEKLSEIMDYHTANNDVVRFDKFKHIVSEILAEPLTEKRQQELAGRFSELVVGRIVASACTPGSMSFLQRFSEFVPLVLISVTPEEELLDILQQRGLAHFFIQIYGAAWAKDAAMVDYMIASDIAPENCVYVGDTPEDSMYAHNAGVAFIGRDSGRHFDQTPVHFFRHMDDVANCIETLFCLKKSI